jgi:hypothetical protein
MKTKELELSEKIEIKFKGKWYHVSKNMSDETVEVKITLRGVEVWHKGALIKRWKHLEYVRGIAASYGLEKYLLYLTFGDSNISPK